MSWSSFKHQKTAASILQRSLQRERLAHAYLFVADSITEAETLARELAKVVNCQKNDYDACDQCAACKKIGASNHPDVRWIRPESKSRRIAIEQIRELEQPLYLAAGEGRIKVAVVVEADRLGPEAANAFLKTLEEPPENSLILLLTTEPQRLLETILSRCLRVTLASGVAAEVSARQKEALNQFTKLLETKDSKIAAAYRFLGWLTTQLEEMRKEAGARVEERAQLERYKETSPEWVKDQEEMLEAATVAEYSRDRALLLAALARWLRDVMLCAEGADEQWLAYPAQASRAKKLAASRGPAADWRARVAAFETLQEQLGRNVNETLALEIALLELCDLESPGRPQAGLFSHV